MLVWHIFVLSLIQGLTEFLPISSSAHLILVPIVTGWEDQGASFDIAVHVGTLSAVVLYFRHEVKTLFLDWLASISARKMVGESRLAWGVILGSIPLGVGGLLIGMIGQDYFRTPMVIALATLVFGVLLWWSDMVGQRDRDENSLSIKDIMVIGIAQVFALVPGASRSGVTMTAALVLGLTRQAAARFSFLLSIPAIIMAGSYEGYKAVTHQVQVNWIDLGIGALVSCISALLCIHLFLKLLEKIGMLPFVIYRLALGVFLIYVFM